MTNDSSDDLLGTGGAFNVLSEVQTDREDPFAGRQLGDYQVVELIAEGGMGRVYRAQRTDGSFERDVAVKVSPVGGIDERMRDRFLQEQAVLAGLNHPNICQLYDAQMTEDGWPYIVMELIDGSPVDRYCEEHQPDEDSRIRLLIDIVGAVAYSHARLVVHRDLKPSNILIDTEGRAKLLDFGIAKLVDDGNVAATQQRPMTLRYASPEQLLGQPVQVASDIYQLGLLIYEVIAGEPLERGTTLADAIQSASDGEEVRLSVEQRSKLPADLRRIVEHALRSDPDERYSSAAELRDDLEAYSQGFPVAAAGQGAGYRTRKFIRRNWLPVSIAATALVALVVSTTWYTMGLTEARIAAEESAQLARDEMLATDRSRLETEAMVKLFKEVFRSVGADGRQLDAITVKEMLEAGATKVSELLPEDTHVRVPAANEFAGLYFEFEMFDIAKQINDIGIEAAEAGGADPWDIDQSYLVKQVLMSTARNYTGALEVATKRWEMMQAFVANGERWASVRQMQIATTAGSYNRSIGDFDEARSWLERALTFEEPLAINPAIHVNLLINLAALGDEQAQYDVAKDYYLRALTLARDKLGEGHAFTGVVLKNLGVHHEWQTDLDEAYAYYVQANEILTHIYGQESSNYADGLVALGKIEAKRGNFVAAAEMVEESLRLFRQTLAEGSGAIAAPLLSLGNIYRRLGRLDESADMYEQALQILATGQGYYAEEIGGFVGAAMTERERGNQNEAERLLQAAYAAAAEHWDEDDKNMASLYRESAAQAWTRDDATTAKEYWERIEAIAAGTPDLRDAAVFGAIRDYLEYLQSSARSAEVEQILSANPGFARAMPE